MKKTKGLVKLNLLVFLLTFVCAFNSFLLPVLGYQTSPPLTEAYGYSYPDGLDTYFYTFQANRWLLYLGYNNKIYRNVHAYYVRRTMGNDAVFIFNGHGAPGRLVCWDGYRYTTVSANAVYWDNNNYSLQAAFQGTTELYDLKLAVFMGCNTGDPDAVYGDLAVKSAQLGIDVAMTWVDNLRAGISDFYLQQFFYYAAYCGYTIRETHRLALGDTYYAFGSYGGTNSLRYGGHRDPGYVRLGGYGS